VEKISKVVAGSVKGNIDMSKERPMRSGAPGYGAPIAYSAPTLKKMALEKQMAESKAAAALQEKPDVNKHSEIVDKVTLNFYKVAPNAIQSEIVDSTPEESESMSPMNVVEDSGLSQSEKASLSLYA